eukprot:TRINITY_DN4342_c0_g1_i1.p1 TRINITY_DN4342_c0_g1~~TRINITY_DN4342_c0_g1_i1.p1  ORF type:complete len:187 (+),score=93.33 TRINITY_DN4342_c0_g1_i1:52-612(+)
MSGDEAVLRRLCGELEDRCEGLEEELAAAQERIRGLSASPVVGEAVTCVPVDSDAPPPPPPAGSPAGDAPINQAFEILSLVNHCVPDDTAEGMAKKCELVKELVERHRSGGGHGGGADSTELEVQKRLNYELEEQMEAFEKEFEAVKGEHDGMKMQLAKVRCALSEHLGAEVGDLDEALEKLKAKA